MLPATPPAERSVERHCGLESLQAHLGERIWAIYTRDQLIDAMYRDERVVSDRTVDSQCQEDPEEDCCGASGA